MPNIRRKCCCGGRIYVCAQPPCASTGCYVLDRITGGCTNNDNNQWPLQLPPVTRPCPDPNTVTPLGARESGCNAAVWVGFYDEVCQSRIECVIRMSDDPRTPPIIIPGDTWVWLRAMAWVDCNTVMVPPMGAEPNPFAFKYPIDNMTVTWGCGTAAQTSSTAFGTNLMCIYLPTCQAGEACRLEIDLRYKRESISYNPPHCKSCSGHDFQAPSMGFSAVNGPWTAHVLLPPGANDDPFWADPNADPPNETEPFYSDNGSGNANAAWAQNAIKDHMRYAILRGPPVGNTTDIPAIANCPPGSDCCYWAPGCPAAPNYGSSFYRTIQDASGADRLMATWLSTVVGPIKLNWTYTVWPRELTVSREAAARLHLDSYIFPGTVENYSNVDVTGVRYFGGAYETPVIQAVLTYDTTVSAERACHDVENVLTGGTPTLHQLPQAGTPGNLYRGDVVLHLDVEGRGTDPKWPWW